MRLPEPAVALLRRQHGAVARFQLLAWLCASTIETHLTRGFLVSLERGVYGTRYTNLTPLTAASAALLRARGRQGAQARLTGPFVLALVGLDGFRTADPFEVLTPPGRHLRGVTFSHRREPTPSAPTARINGLATVTVTAALVDCAGRDDVAPRRLRVALDAARARGLTTDDRLVRRARALGARHRGARAILELEADGFLRCESEPERELGRLVAVIDPRPVPQGRVGRRRIDWLWPAYGWGLEYLGAVDHLGTTARSADLARTGELRQGGVVVCELTADDLRLGERLVTWIHARLMRRAQELGAPPPLLRPLGDGNRSP